MRRIVYTSSVAVLGLNADGSPASFLMVQASYLGATEDPVEDQRSFIGPTGSATLTGMRAGPWRVTVSKVGADGGGEPLSSEVDVKIGETSELPFVL